MSNKVAARVARRPVRRKPRIYGGVEHDSRQADRRERLIRAGIKVFGTNGYHGATVRAICEEARLTGRYLYESFENLEQLFIACYRQTQQDYKVRLIAETSRAPRDVDSL